MNKDIRNSIIFVIIGIIIVLAIIIPIAIKHNKENEELKKSFSTIGNSAKEYVEEKENVKSHIDEFSYNNTTGEVEYHSAITLEMYNRIEEGMTKEEVIAILGKEDAILGEGEGENYIIEYGDSLLKKGYWIHFTMERKTNKVINKKQVGLE